jgi:hypothetical protein
VAACGERTKPLFRKEEVKGNEDLDIVLRKPFEVVDIDRRLFKDALKCNSLAISE